MVRGLVHHDEVRPARDAEREQQLADLARRGLRGFEQAPGTRPEPREARHHVAEPVVGELLRLGEDAGGLLRGDFLRDEDEVLGLILRIDCKVGDAVKENQQILVMEAMKMENPIYAPCNGTVQSINVTQGQQMNPDDVLLVIG